ncbi:hypothetical protein BEH94_06050 [Candidatus Altiarchaeales archaeon WOR_SM1_SCG]|nr:hypothetical protein BEH94_06050 [Candidatus Altiarchaeales archaeon WOR_SM1_SCG]
MTTKTIQGMAKVVETFGYKVIPLEKPKVSVADELLGKFETKKGGNISADVKKLRESGYGKY